MSFQKPKISFVQWASSQHTAVVEFRGDVEVGDEYEMEHNDIKYNVVVRDTNIFGMEVKALVEVKSIDDVEKLYERMTSLKTL